MRNGVLTLGTARMNYVFFGKGKKALILLPGVGDGLKTVKGMAVPFALLYRRYARDYRVYALSRKEPLSQGVTTRDMAADVICAMDQLHIPRASVLGVSQGGMIAQYMAIDHPERVDKLVLAVTCCAPGDTLREAVNGWIAMAEAGDYRSILTDTTERSYTPAKLKAARPLYGLVSLVGKPRDFTRFIFQARSCLTHDAQAALHKIKCPTLVIGGDDDRIVGGDSSPALAAGITGSRLLLYKGLGHGLYEEAKDFHQQVLHFLSDAQG